MIKKNFWCDKKVLITGHTGFKGTWLTLWLSLLGAKVVGYSLDAPSNPNLFDIVNGNENCISITGDINNYSNLLFTVKKYQPEIIFHLAAQSLVRKSYRNPIETFYTNVLGTGHVLEVVRQTKIPQAVIIVTSDKCYENDDTSSVSFRETDPLGGYDPYSASKGCAELITSSFQRSFFKESNIKIASVRAGNVIGGGDWSEDRLFPDLIRGLLKNQSISLRNPWSIRPWQYVLEPLNGYLLLTEKLWNDKEYTGGWNFGPIDDQFFTVDEITRFAVTLWGKEIETRHVGESDFHESKILKLDSTKAVQKLKWRPKLSQKESVQWTMDWYKKYAGGKKMKLVSIDQIEQFQRLE